MVFREVKDMDRQDIEAIDCSETEDITYRQTEIYYIWTAEDDVDMCR